MVRGRRVLIDTRILVYYIRRSRKMTTVPVKSWDQRRKNTCEGIGLERARIPKMKGAAPRREVMERAWSHLEQQERTRSQLFFRRLVKPIRKHSLPHPTYDSSFTVHAIGYYGIPLDVAKKEKTGQKIRTKDPTIENIANYIGFLIKLKTAAKHICQLGSVQVRSCRLVDDAFVQKSHSDEALFIKEASKHKRLPQTAEAINYQSIRYNLWWPILGSTRDDFDSTNEVPTNQTLSYPTKPINIQGRLKLADFTTSPRRSQILAGLSNEVLIIQGPSKDERPTVLKSVSDELNKPLITLFFSCSV